MSTPAPAVAEALHLQTEQPMRLAMIGLGKMGLRMALKLHESGHHIVGWDLSEDVRRQAAEAGLHVAGSLEEAVTGTYRDGERAEDGQRVVWSMLPADEPTETALNQAAAFLTPGDILIDGGNSHFDDTDRRAKAFGERALRFLGIGVSGGIIARHNGYPLMVGGDESAYNDITPILDTLGYPNGGHEYFGEGGAGHFVKAVHNAIEYPIMQAIGEGIAALYARGIDPLKAALLYQKGTLVSGFMIDRAVEALLEDPTLESYDGEIGSNSDEVAWVIEFAKGLGLPVGSFEQAVEYRQRSKIDQSVRDGKAAKMVAALRVQFGGHPVKRTQPAPEA